jgi:RIP metalloprotease RseP
VTTLLAFLFVLGVLVFIHELGHFLLARWNGVRVLVFSLGFGPKILKVQRGDTEYCISIIPARTRKISSPARTTSSSRNRSGSASRS